MVRMGFPPRLMSLSGVIKLDAEWGHAATPRGYSLAPVP
jgi:hypothetical protein